MRANSLSTWFDRNIRYLLLVPLGALLLLLLAYPFLFDVYLSFQESQAGRTLGFAGLSNYVRLLSDARFWQSLAFSLRFALTVTALEVFLGLGIALFVDRYLVKNQWVVALFLMPMLVPPVLMGIMFQLMLNRFVGVLPYYLSALGVNFSFLGRQGVMATLVAADVIQWTPFAFLILFSGLQMIPPALREAAAVDGARGGQVLRLIVLPILLPTIGITAFLRFIEAFRTFDLIYALTGGGPGNLTTTVSIYIYKTAFEQWDFSGAVVGSLVLLVLAIVPLLISMKVVFRGEGGA